jgi:beta-glucuronidase
VYWTILWENEQTYENAERQLTEMITRDKNRACVILWSMANETPVGAPRLKFLSRLVAKARGLDPSRLITAAVESHSNGNTVIIDDAFGEYLDVLGCNEYFGWYSGPAESCDEKTWQCKYDKPLIISEFGGGALYGLHADKDTRWSEEFQENIYQHQVIMLQKIDNLRGVTPWILKDFRSPRRPLPFIQDFFNRKGLISDKGQKKKAFYKLQGFYQSLAEKENESK